MITKLRLVAIIDHYVTFGEEMVYVFFDNETIAHLILLHNIACANRQVLEYFLLILKSSSCDFSVYLEMYRLLLCISNRFLDNRITLCESCRFNTEHTILTLAI